MDDEGVSRINKVEFSDSLFDVRNPSRIAVDIRDEVDFEVLDFLFLECFFNYFTAFCCGEGVFRSLAVLRTANADLDKLDFWGYFFYNCEVAAVERLETADEKGNFFHYMFVV